MSDQGNAGGERRFAREFVAGVRRKARATLLAAAWSRALALVVGVVLILGIADYLFRLPRGIRVLHLLAMAYGGFEVFRRLILPALRFRPSLADVALRLERAEGAAETRGRLASGVDLDAASEPTGLTAALAARVVRGADRAAESVRGLRFIRTRQLTQSAMLLGLALLISGALAVARPHLAAIGIGRTFLPFAQIEWPKRTGVADATASTVHPIGEALPLRALVTRTSQAPGRTRVTAAFRVIAPGRHNAIERVMLTSQDRQDQAAGVRGELFERLIEPELGGATAGEIEYWFETEDDRSPTRRIALAARPRVETISAVVSPPAYARTLSGAFVGEGVLAVTPDGEGVAAIGPILAGSSVEVTIRLNKPASRVGPEEGWSQPAGDTLRFETVLSDRARTQVSLVDDAGLESAEPLAIAMEVVEDAPPGVTVVEPAFDESVLSTAVLAVAAEGRDDLAMQWLTIREQLARRPADSEGAPHEALGEANALARNEAPAGPGATDLRAEAVLDLSVIGARAGDEVWLTAAGRDVFAAPLPGEPDGRIVESPVRRVRIIDETTFIEQIRGELAGVRKAAIEIDDEQRSVRDATDEGPDEEDLSRRQGSVTERLDAQHATLDRLGGRIDRNGLDDQTLSGMLGDAAALLEDATRASDEAGRALEELAATEEPEDRARAADAQERVRESLNDLISMLDQGQDSWVARRTIESLLADQRSLLADTAELGDRTMGQSVEQLAAEELSELERIAARQRDAAERARQALESLTDRADLLKGVDPGQAQAMSQAAQRGRQERIAEQMRQAAAQVAENQTRAAAQGQQAAAEALEQMLEDIDSSDSARDQALRRVLASVLESLDRLISAQESEIASLTRAQIEQELPGLADAMVTLASNTLGLLDEIGEQRDLATVASPVGRAADAQERAVASLRGAKPDDAAEAEDESLARLREAKAEAERLEEEAGSRESNRKRAELRQAYRDLLEQQVTIADETAPFVGVELDRRSRSQVRGVGQKQQGLSEELLALRGATAELSDAAIFDLAHRRMDAASAAAADRLLAGEADPGVQRHQATVSRLLQSLLEAMAERGPDQQFRNQDGSAGGGGGGPGGGETPMIPDLAELKLLRAMQAEAMEWTRNIDEAPARPDDGQLGELAELQQELAERGRELIQKLTQPPQEPAQQGDPR